MIPFISNEEVTPCSFSDKKVNLFPGTWGFKVVYRKGQERGGDSTEGLVVVRLEVMVG